MVGDVWGNVEALGAFVERAVDAGCDMVVFPEMCVCGYPPEDLLLKKHFLVDNQKAVETLAGRCGDITVVAGFAEFCDETAYNSLGVMRNGRLEAVYRKCVLPNYGVFDEKRYFHAGSEPLIIEVKGVSVALTICEDIWQLDWLKEFLDGDKRKDLIVNISGRLFIWARSGCGGKR